MATTFGVGSGDVMRPYGECHIKHYPEAASQTFKRGTPVIMDSASTENRVKTSADNPTAAIVGIAAADASGVTGALLPVYEAKPHLRFVGRTVAADAVDFTDIGSARAIQAHASLAGVWVVDTSDAGNDSVVVEGYLNPTTNSPLTAEADLEVNVIFHFDPKATIFGAGT